MIDNIIEKTLNGVGDSDGHLLTLFSIAVSSKSKIMLELGVRNGSTTMPLFEAAKINNSFLYSVDINDVDFELDEKYWKFIKSDSIEYLKTLNTTIDLVYIDDWHSYDHVKKELEIFYGNDKITEIFNKNSFINWHEFDNDEKFIEKIIEVDNDDNLYLDYLNQPIINNLDSLKMNELSEHLKNMIG